MPAARFPVSVKGVVLDGDGRVALLRNERDEWERPGGKLGPGESPEACLVREVHEELGLRVTPGALLDAWVHEVRAGESVLVVAYGCRAAPFAAVTPSEEHRAAGLFTPDEAAALPMPDGYRRAIRAWAARSRRS